MTSERIERMIESQIRSAEENGEFADLPGAGKPLPGIYEPYDEDWWIKKFLEREGLTGQLMLPPSIQLAREVEKLPEVIRKLPSEQRVRETVADLNREIIDYQLQPSTPFVPIRRVDPDAMVALWRQATEARWAAARRPAPASPVAEPDKTEKSSQGTGADRPGLRRLFRRRAA